VVVVNRSPQAAAVAAALAGPIGSVGALADVADADVVVNTTSVGMGSRESPIPAALLRADQVVADIVYHPRRTALLDAAEAAGATTVDGLGMLVHQAALQQALWTGRTPDVAAMRDAAERELAAREAAALR
jgi:shikimate dehydrogenase